MQVAMARGHLDPDRAYRAYRASVRSVWDAVLPYVDAWLSEGHRVVVTTDHGEAFGTVRDGTMYEHPCNVNIRPLTRVPWVEFTPPETRSETEGSVEARLAALGYAE
jgi:hypothetical protein